jgi:hypothetical protein
VAVVTAVVALVAGTPAPASAAPVARRTFLVTFAKGTDPVAQAARLRAQGFGVRNVYRHVFPGVAVDLPEAAAVGLARNPVVRRVEADGPVRAVDTRSSATWGLDRTDQRSLPLNAAYTYPNTAGAGVYAYVVDTGVRATHTQFTGRMAAGYTAIADGAGTNDCNGHGTHVAGTIAGATWGMASKATVVPVRVLDCAGSGTWSGVIAGLDFVAGDTARRPAVANLSLSGGASQSVDDAVARAIAAGVTVAVAAGNENLDACGSSPARAPSALTIGATTSTDARSSFSNYGSCVDLFAPGSSITSAWSTGDSASNTISGTSMAAPHVAGAAAIALGVNPTLTPAQVSAALIGAATANIVGSPGAGSPNRLLYADPGGSQPPPPPPAPSNDPFAGASVVTVGGTGSITADSSAASKEAGEPSHAGNSGGASLWWSVTPTVSGPLTLSTQASSIDTLLAVYTGTSVGTLTPVASNDDADYAAAKYWSTVTVSVTAGVTYLVAVDGFGGARGGLTLGWSSNAPAPLAVSTSSLPAGTVSAGYSASLVAAGGSGPYSWSLASGTLPAGLTLSTAGSISGTPTTAGSSAFTVAVTDGVSTTTRSLSLVVATPVSVSTSSLVAGKVAVAYSVSLVASGGSGPYSWSLASGTLPAGLALSTAGSISGTPTTAATSSFTVRVTDAAGRTATRALSITIATTTTKPGTFGKSSPSNGVTGRVTTNLGFSWAAATGATSYQICLSRTTTCGTGSTGWVSVGTARSVAFSGLASRTVYYWQVQAVNAAGVTNANGGTWWKFTTG